MAKQQVVFFIMENIQLIFKHGYLQGQTKNKPWMIVYRCCNAIKARPGSEETEFKSLFFCRLVVDVLAYANPSSFPTKCYQANPIGKSVLTKSNLTEDDTAGYFLLFFCDGHEVSIKFSFVGSFIFIGDFWETKEAG